MKVELISHSGESPRLVGEVRLVGGSLQFSNLATKELCIQVAMDGQGAVPPSEPERFLRALPVCLSGGALRARLVEP